jgi:hypothetical protein
VIIIKFDVLPFENVSKITSSKFLDEVIFDKVSKPLFHKENAQQYQISLQKLKFHGGYTLFCFYCIFINKPFWKMLLGGSYLNLTSPLYASISKLFNFLLIINEIFVLPSRFLFFTTNLQYFSNRTKIAF